jgi:3-oxoacyl-[acyl-carrier-protein] synthase-3
MIPVRIAGTGSLGPGRVVTTAELAARAQPPRPAAEMEERTGILRRHVADPGDTCASLGAEVLRRALGAAAMTAGDLERLVFVSSLGGDMTFPATANLVGAALDLAGSCDCFDLNNACMGFVTAFDLAARHLATGGGPVGIAVVELGSRFVTPDDPRPYLVFADAAAGAVLVPGSGEGVLASVLRNDGVAFGNVRLEHAGLTGRRETMRFTASSQHIRGEAIEAVRWSTRETLARAGVALDDVRWVLPHQPNGALLQDIQTALGVEDDRLVPMVQDFGSVGAASIPVSLDQLWRSGRVQAGDRILMVGVGAGMSYGALLYQVAS